MATTAPSDPYRILGVDASADSAAIKKAYRKLVLSCHPDKVTDESLKAQKQEEFHQIQQAYETIGDPDKRSKYDLELKAKKLREERDRAVPSKGSTPQSRNVNINIYTVPHPSEYRSSSSKHSSPAKPASYKPYSAEFSKSCEHDIPNRSRAYQEEKKTRRTYSDERLNDERKRREDDRERERLHRRRQEEEDERRRRQARREKEERDLKERARAKEAAKRREREQREQQEREDRMRAEMKAEKRAKERAAEVKRKQDLAEEKLRAKMRSQEQTSEEDDDRRSRAKKSSSKKESPRDKTPSKYRERSSPRDDVVPDLPTSSSTADALESKMAYAALYIRGQQAKKSGKTSPKHTADAPTYSDAYPDPEQWKPKRRVSGEKPPKAGAAAEAIINDATSPPISPATQQQGPPPRLHKSYTMGHVPATAADPRPSLGRSQTFDQDAFARSMGGSERPRMSRQRTSIDEEDYYTPRVSKYGIRPDRTVYETSQHREPYVAGGTFPKVKTTQSYGPEVVSHSRRYDQADLTFVDYPTAQQQAYVATHS